MSVPIFYTKHTIDKDDVEAVAKALKGDWLTQGPAVKEFESKIAEFCGVRYAISANSGTSALHIAAFAAGIKEGDEVVTTPLSFVATANCILYQKGIPVFADIDYGTGLLDPKEVEKKITKRTKAVITVDYAGHPSYFSKLRRICRKHRLILIDDACHSLGALYRSKPIGSQADISVFSFHPAKAITTLEGGMVVTNNEKFYKRSLLLRSHGITKNPTELSDKTQGGNPWFYEMQDIGFNYRLSDIQCALGISQLKKIGDFLRRRREIADYYTMRLKDDPRFLLPRDLTGSQSAWHLYPLRICDKKISKEEVFRRFNKNNIFPQVHFIPIHTHPYYSQRFGYKLGDFPKAEKFYKEEISLPVYPALKRSDVYRIIRILRQKI